MKGDFTRRTFRSDKRYGSVRMQQGRVQMDADWNEQIEIQQYLSRLQTQDVVGRTGVASSTPLGFQVSAFTDRSAHVSMKAGRIYVDGILCENFVETSYVDQPFSPLRQADLDSMLQQLPPGQAILAYLEVWERPITGLEDPDTVEVALGGADTAIRTQTVWQLKLQPFQLAAGDLAAQGRAVTPEGRFSPLSALDVLTDASAPPSGNQLYRIEIHDPSKDGIPTLKWSRDNGAVVAAWMGGTGTVQDPIVIRSRTRFRAGQFVELTDDAHELRQRPGLLLRIASADGLPGLQRLTLEDPGGLLARLGEFTDNPDKGWQRKARLWDSGAIPISTTVRDDSNFINIPLPDSGVSLRVSKSGTFFTGDAWLLPVRQGTTPARAEPAEDVHHLARLAVIGFDRTFTSTTDLRTEFSDLGAISTLLRTASDLVNRLNALAPRLRHYHGIVDIDSNMPLVVFLHFEDAPFVPQRVKLFLRGQQFSTAFYTEMGGHTHGGSVGTLNLTHRHGGTTNGGGNHTHRVRSGTANSEAIIQLTGGNAGTGLTNPPQIEAVSDHTHGFTTLDALGNVTPGVTISRFGANGIDAGTERKQFLNGMRIFIDGTDRTEDIRRRWGPPSFGDGTANSPLVTTGTGVLDITDLVPRAIGSHELRFTVASGGGRLLYDIFCE